MSEEITLGNSLPEIRNVMQRLEELAEKWHLDNRILFDISLSLDELLTNIISYGYQDDTAHQIRIGIELKADQIIIVLQDDGREFNPLSAKSPDFRTGLNEKPIGGLGIHLVRKMMDGVDYRREAGLNILTLTKNLD
ncbi:MAG: ATP-binding protein [Candidatus Cloacimonetes bacterium]|nr:ATP-binding protein [Candidatus Cloacimonadota bacterium]